MQAIILAAGMGRRLKELTKGNTKCMVEVNGVTIIERLLNMLDQRGLSRIVIVVGYCGDKLEEFISTLGIKTPIVYISNDIYDKTNNIFSLSLAKDYLEEENTLLFESDLVFESKILDRLMLDPRENLAVVAKYESWMDGTCLVLDSNDNITDFIPGKILDFHEKNNYYKTVNIYKFSADFSKRVYIPFLDAYRKAKGENEYYESVIKIIALLGTQELRAMRLSDEVWYEIDDIQDLDIAESLFSDETENKYQLVSERYGGYWRYPRLLDFCYLVNPFFPSVRMLEEMKSSFETLIANYPSGTRVNTLLASRNHGIPSKHIVIGNGASELIKCLLEMGDLGRIGVIRPTFEEYVNRYQKDKIEIFVPQNNGYRYTEKDVIAYFSEKPINTLVIINPDNPSGNFISLQGIRDILLWAKKRSIKVIADESFLDFAVSTERFSLLDEQFLNEHKNLYVIKSISKSYGVPGIRLGLLATSDENAILSIRKSLPIWNINSFAEFFMQIFTKYEKDYVESLEKVEGCRRSLLNALNELDFLECYETQANYIMCQVLKGTSRELVVELYENNILVKDLTPKINDGKQYIRVAIRTEEDNKRLLDSLKKYGTDYLGRDNE